MKKIINGFGKIGKDGKYITSPKDRKKSIEQIKELASYVENILTKKFGSFIYNEEESKPHYWKLIEVGCAYIHTPNIVIDSPNFRTNSSALIAFDTGINKNGYGENTFKRHYVISFELKGKIRYKFQKNWTEGTILKKYCLADNGVDAVVEFQEFIEKEFDKFFINRVPKNLTYNQDFR